MNKFERFNSEQQVLKHLEDLFGHGVNEEDVTVVSKSRLVELSSRFPNVTYKDAEGGIMEKISSLFTDELPEDKVLNSLDLTVEERETCRQAIDQEDVIVFNAYHDFNGALDGEHYDMSKDDHTDGVVDTDKKSATLAGAQFGSHDAGREPMFNNEDEVDENVENEGKLDQRDASDKDFFDEQNKVDTDEGTLPEHETHRLNDEEYLKETKNAEGLKTGNKEEGMDTNNGRNKEFAFGKDNPRDDVSELDKGKENIDDEIDSEPIIERDNTSVFPDVNSNRLDDDFDSKPVDEPVDSLAGQNDNLDNDYSEPLVDNTDGFNEENSNTLDDEFETAPEDESNRPLDDINESYNGEKPNTLDDDFGAEIRPEGELSERFTDNENNDAEADYDHPVEDSLDDDFERQPDETPIDNFNEDKNPDDDYTQPRVGSEDERVRQEVTNDDIHEQNLANKSVAEDYNNQESDYRGETEGKLDNAAMKEETVERDIQVERSSNVERRTVNADRDRNDSVDGWDISQEESGPINNFDDLDNPRNDEQFEGRPDEDHDKNLDEEEASHEALEQADDLDFDDTHNREKRSNRLDDTLRADEAREDAFDHDKGRF